MYYIEVVNIERINGGTTNQKAFSQSEIPDYTAAQLKRLRGETKICLTKTLFHNYNVLTTITCQIVYLDVD